MLSPFVLMMRLILAYTFEAIGLGLKQCYLVIIGRFFCFFHSIYVKINQHII